MPGGEFFEPFIQDYFSECDELLAALRRGLLSIDVDEVDGAVRLQEVARALHTLKGLSAMVGLGPAEQVAHAMEDAGRALAGSPDLKQRELVELLFAGERLLEEVIDARRKGSPIPEPDDYLRRVRASMATVDPTAGAGQSIAVRRPNDATSCRFEFSPSAELAARGVGVEMIRQRLTSIGNITQIIPRVKTGGGVEFEFVVELAAGRAPDEAWRDDGLTWSWEPESTRVAALTVRGHSAPAVQSTAIGSNTVRVDLARLDDLMRMVGELVITRARLGESLAQMEARSQGASWDDLREANERIERQLRTIREGVMRIRLVSVGDLFERMRFAMRDIAREAGKEVHLDFSGQEKQIDKLIVDRMLEPLLHLVRNSVSHGIESPGERLARGKSAAGLISLRARTAGDRILLEIEDDGAGIDTRRVAKRARDLGLLDADSELLPDTLLEIICSPGFSTRDTADLASGRGIGMSVVRTTVRSLGGELFVDSELGRGTRFTIELPLTLMITDALLVEVGDQPMAIPQVALREIVPYDASSITRFESNEVLSYRDRVLPLINLAAHFRLTATAPARPHILVVGSDAHPAGLVVDRILGLREIVVHPLSDPLTMVQGVAGATELADGRVSLILDAAALVRRSGDTASATRRPDRAPSRAIRNAPAVPSWS